MLKNRLDNVDILRGLVMVVMALDHTRDFVMPRPDPVDLVHTTPFLFFTRWITHFCAPVFVFLAGTGAYLHGTRGKTDQRLEDLKAYHPYLQGSSGPKLGRSRVQLAVFLITRGLWCIFLELTIIRLWWTFNLDFRETGVGVFWPLGWAMIVLAFLQFLPAPVVAGFGLVMIVGHNALDSITPFDERLGPFGGVWAVLHGGTNGVPVPIGKYVNFYPGYPLIPWIGVMAAGYGFGALLLRPQRQRRIYTLALGICAIAAFLVLRLNNIYGDPKPWDIQTDVPLTICSIGNCYKYPPSLSYLCMTLGPALIFLAATDREAGWLGRRLIVFGRVPLFYYLIHLPLIHVFAFCCAYYQLGPAMFKLFTDENVAAGVKVNNALSDFPHFGSLPLVYAVWAVVIVLLYPVCAWYAGFKQRHRDWWVLSYL